MLKCQQIINCWTLTWDVFKYGMSFIFWVSDEGWTLTWDVFKSQKVNKKQYNSYVEP